jgi:hypothetical protein
VLAKSDPEYDTLGDTSKGCILSVTGTTNQSGLFDGTWRRPEVERFIPDETINGLVVTGNGPLRKAFDLISWLLQNVP